MSNRSWRRNDGFLLFSEARSILSDLGESDCASGGKTEDVFSCSIVSVARITSDEARREEDNAEETGDGAASLAENHSAMDWSLVAVLEVNRQFCRCAEGFPHANPNTFLSALPPAIPPFRRGKRCSLHIAKKMKKEDENKLSSFLC